jgi:glycosyltransferase involved in cell wall biosynthesis
MPPMNLRILSSYEPAPGDATVMPELYRRNASLGPSVIIVLGTYQGEQFLREQLESIAAQTHRNWRLLVSDDGSTDRTRAIVREFGAALESDSQLMLVEGPRRGCVANFLSAICDAPEADYYAFCDQDDIWETDKLGRALSILQARPSGRPALYCGRTRVVDSTGQPMGLSPAFLRPPSFANALVQSIGGGNTMVMNRQARNLLRAAGPAVGVVSHDWWSYQLVTGAGGTVYYDREPTIRYRQHGSNLTGANNTLGARWKRGQLLLHGRFKQWTDRNIGALNGVRHLLTAENRAVLDSLIALRTHPFPRNLITLHKSGVHRQTWQGNLGLILATALRKL